MRNKELWIEPMQRGEGQDVCGSYQSSVMGPVAGFLSTHDYVTGLHVLIVLRAGNTWVRIANPLFLPIQEYCRINKLCAFNTGREDESHQPPHPHDNVHFVAVSATTISDTSRSRSDGVDRGNETGE